MNTPAESLALLARALDQLGTLLSRVGQEQAALATPCRSWNVRQLVSHVVDEVDRFAASTATGERGHGAGDPIGQDVSGWPDAYQAAAGRLLATWHTPGAYEREQHLPGGTVPASWSLRQQLTELTVHAWDLAKATGQSTDLDPELGAAALGFGLANLPPEIRGEESAGHQIGAEVTVPDDGPLYDRLAAFCGRNPSH
ncbi:TIGR03086 family metal-binding protein [Nonomuraea jabiensis]|uniref:TIGR03086 family metal-binding protein n=1 Tax=Nonomuraea jabiensis TaxID=882448 RepID=UPI00341926C8